MVFWFIIVVPDSNPAVGGILSNLKQGSIAFNYHPRIVLIWLKYFQKDIKLQIIHPSMGLFAFCTYFQSTLG